MDYSDLKIPNHVAIIVDGNGRWAKERGMSRLKGHDAGFENLKKISKYILDKGIKILSVYVFSTENFKRSEEEVSFIMDLFAKNFRKDAIKFNKKNIKIVFSGRREQLRKDVIDTIDYVTELTKNNTGNIINFCFNYGGQTEIVDATKKIIDDVNKGIINKDDINVETFSKYLYQDLPQLDFLIRTSGEYRVSNFMLWQLSYAEMYFPLVCFPDFSKKDFDEAILKYNKRDRRFGGINYEGKNN